MKNKRPYDEHFFEVINEYTDEELNLSHIDGYESEDENAAGRTIAVVDRDTKKVIYFDNGYRGQKQIQAAIDEVLADIDNERAKDAVVRVEDGIKDSLIDEVIEEMKKDFQYEDVTAIFDLLQFCPTENLIQYLPEEKWGLFGGLKK